MNRDVLQKAGIDYEARLERFMGDEALYHAVLEAFADDDVVKRARRAYDKQDKKALLSAVHEAKGSSGNSGMNTVYRISAELVSLLRRESCDEDELTEGYRKFETAYLCTQAAVREALGGCMPASQNDQTKEH